MRQRGLDKKQRGMGEAQRWLCHRQRRLNHRQQGMSDRQQGMDERQRGMDDRRRGMGHRQRGMCQPARGMSETQRGLYEPSLVASEAQHPVCERQKSGALPARARSGRGRPRYKLPDLGNSSIFNRRCKIGRWAPNPGPCWGQPGLPLSIDSRQLKARPWVDALQTARMNPLTPKKERVDGVHALWDRAEAKAQLSLFFSPFLVF